MGHRTKSLGDVTLGAAPSDQDPAEARFEHYLDAQGYSREHEPDLGVPTRPDYLIERDGLQAACEVKGFKTLGIWGPMLASPGTLVSRSMKEALRPIRRQIGTAAKQLKPLSSRGLPLVVVLANPRAAGVDLHPHMVISAMYGDLEAQFTTAGAGEPTSEWVAGRNGRLTNDHPHISAVVVVHEGDRSADRESAFVREFTTEHPEAGAEEALHALRAARQTFGPAEPYYRCDVFEAASGACVPLADELLNGADDARWRSDGDGHMVRIV